MQVLGDRKNAGWKLAGGIAEVLGWGEQRDHVSEFWGNSSQKDISTYFRRRFFVGDPVDISDGTELVTVHLTPPPAADSRWLVRLWVEQE